MKDSMVDQSADREERPNEETKRYEKRGYSAENAICQGSQHDNTSIG